jgi:uncharacterized spore protein YtfJ
MSGLQMGKPITVVRTTLVPIEKVAVGNLCLGQGFWLYGSKEPLAVLVCDNGGVRVLSVHEDQFTLAALIRGVPGLESALEQLAACQERRQ